MMLNLHRLRGYFPAAPNSSHCLIAGLVVHVIICTAATVVSAQEGVGERGRIETDRHDFTQSPETVGEHVFQIESGYTFFNGSGVDSHTGPELMARYGISEDIEIRLRYNEVWQFGNEHRSGSEDLRPSLKLRLNDQQDWLPESALELRLSVPTGAAEFSTGEVKFGFDYIYGWRLNEKAEVYGSTGLFTNANGDFAFLPEDPNDEFMLATQSIALGVEVSERVTIYSEFFGLFTHGFGEKEENPIFFNVGVDYYVSPDFVIDLRVGTGLNDDAEDLFVGIGGGYRF